MTKRKPALGPSFAYMTDATLWLSKCDPDACEDDSGQEPESEDRGPIHVAEVLRSKHTVGFHFFASQSVANHEAKPSKAWCSFRIRDGILSNA